MSDDESEEKEEEAEESKPLRDESSTKCGIENKDDLKPEIEIDLDSSKIAEEKETKQKLGGLTVKELAGKKNKTRAGALIVPHKDVNADSCVAEAKKEEGKDCVPVPFSSKDSDRQICIQDTETDRDPGKETSNESEGVKTILPVSEETDKTETSKEEPDSQNSKETSTQTKAEQPGSATEENDSKTRTFKKNMYRFPSLSREMKRLNMNFVNYTMEESTQEDNAANEKKIKDACTHEHCLLGCICDTLSCRRRDPEHCGRVGMFEC
ncbi:peroxidasin-like [Penaeus japonicus]|uniref:peroxidasin-like n=1 Tax=Penaeus japonicus TaxID=27405 RepID=UPI001C70EEDD|nr:peroxidasin-like [Penaeus japonicus]